MDSITIRKYEPKDHTDVNRMFISGNNDHIKIGLRFGRKNPRVISYLILSFSSKHFLAVFVLGKRSIMAIYCLLSHRLSM